ncbi:MAG TPA: hypothetical protein VGT99_06310 [Gammaproteobacteria bacterium]|nr:hypothetical protein [Gammaproteobacteria bacterium]
MRRWFLLLVLLAGLGITPLASGACVTGDELLGHPELKTRSMVFRDYEIRFYGNPSCEAEPESRIAGFEILKAGKRVYMRTGYSFAPGYALDQDQPPDSVKLKAGDDISGEGVPELLISEWSGGSHCCYSFHLFRLGDEFKRIQSIPLFDADESAFVRRPGIKGLVLDSADYSAFAYFPAGFAGSPAGRVLLSFQQGRFRLDLGLMKADAPAKGAIDKCAALFKKSRDWRDGQPMGMWYYATDLIYTGNEPQALTFLDKSWGGSAADREKYLGEYEKHLSKSIYYPQLKLLQELGPSAADQKIDWTKQCFEYLRG